MNLLLWNVRSLVHNLKFHFILHTLEDNDIHIACITETWLSPSQGHNHTISELNALGYNLSFIGRKSRRGGGVAFLLKDFIKFSPVKYDVQFESFEWDGVTVIDGRTNYCLIGIYRKQEVSMIDFLQHLLCLLENVCSQSTDEVIVLGDFNVHFQTNDKSSCDISDILSQFGLSQDVTESTHIAGNVLDLIFTNPCSLDIEPVVYPKLISTTNRNIKFDHYPIIFNIPVSTTQPSSTKSDPKIVYRRYTRGIDQQLFETHLVDTLNSHEKSSDFYDQLTKYNSSLSSTLNYFAPIQQKIVYQQPSICPGWIDEEYKEQRRIRRKCERDMKKYNTEEAMRKYVRQRDYCVVLCNTKQRSFYSNLVNSTDNQHSLFKTVSKLWNKPKKKILPSNCSASQLANDFNTFFVKKIRDIRKKFKTSSPDLSRTNSFQPSRKFTTFAPISMEKLKEIKKEMTIKTSFNDPLPSWLLEPSFDSLLPYILDLVNLSLETGSIIGLKESIITPIIKKFNLDSEKLAHYRPIVNLQFLSKLIEKCVLDQLTEHMTDNNLHCPEQFAYKKNHSTETMVLQIVNDVLVGFEKGSCTILVLLDMSAAFDTVDIGKLLHILEHQIGLDGTVLQWFRSFLLDREQKVLINGQLSEALLILFGVPQGSVLGPVLFNIYVRSLPCLIQNQGFSTSIYADDSNARTQFSLKFQYHNTVIKVPELIEDISRWMQDHFLKINTSKTELILFLPPCEKDTPKILGTFVGDDCIRFSKTVKLLGVNLDSMMNLDNHINNLVSECFYHLKNISKIRRYLTDHDTKKLVHAFVSSKIDFNNSIFYGLKSVTLAKLQRVQNYAARLVCGFPSAIVSSSSLLHNLHWLNVKQRTMFKILLLVHKFFIGIAPQYFCDLLLVRCWNERLLHVKFMNTVMGKRSFEYISCRLWNRLPLGTRTLDSTEHFKRNVKTILFANENNILNAVTLYTDSSYKFR